MKYEDLYNDFIALFPEDRQFFDDLCKENEAYAEDGIHIVFGLIVLPYIKKIVKESPEKARKAFAFFEEMEKSGDSRIAEVLEFTILEDLITNEKASIELYSVYFGEETKAAAAAMGNWFK